MLQSVQVSSGGVRGVWSRNGVLTRHGRLLRLERHVRDTGIALNDDQVRTLERFSPEFRERLSKPGAAAIWWPWIHFS